MILEQYALLLDGATPGMLRRAADKNKAKGLTNVI